MDKNSEQWKKVEELLRNVEEVQGKKLSAAERNLIERLMDALADGNVGKPGTADIIGEVFAAFEKEVLKPIVEAISKEIVKTVEAINKYFEMQVTAGTKNVGKKVGTEILKSFGIDRTENGFKILTGGYMESLISNTALKNSVQKIVMDAAFGETPFSSMMKQLAKVVAGSDITEGAIRRHFKTMAFDTMNIAARAQEDRLAEEMGFQSFIFAGTVIDNTRCFCKKRVGKVILVSEAITEWPDLLNQECGPMWDKDLEYKPLEQMGGHNCRHHKRYISNREAMRRDSTLKENAKGDLSRAA